MDQHCLIQQGKGKTKVNMSADCGSLSHPNKTPTIVLNMRSTKSSDPSEKPTRNFAYFQKKTQTFKSITTNGEGPTLEHSQPLETTRLHETPIEINIIKSSLFLNSYPVASNHHLCIIEVTESVTSRPFKSQN